MKRHTKIVLQKLDKLSSLLNWFRAEHANAEDIPEFEYIQNLIEVVQEEYTPENKNEKSCG